MKHWGVLILTAFAVIAAGTVKVDAAGLPAFPGAMGGGTLTIGGRNGAIISITNLNDSGAGSFRACVTASGPRYCLCRVGGVVPVLSDINVKSFVRFDGQTCPGGGLILGDGHIVGRALNIASAHDVVIRYLTINVNNPNTPVGPDTGTTGIEIGTGAFNVVLDQLSLMMAGNKALISYTSDTSQAAIIHDVTVQNTFLTLPNVGHPVGPMTDTIAYAYLSCNQDFHHNFWAWIGHRIALYNTSCGHWVSNFTWNWSDPSAHYGFAMEPQGPSVVDMQNNLWVTGNMNAGNTANPHPVNINATGSSDCSVNCWGGATQPSHYMSGNLCAQGADWNCAAQIVSEGGPEFGPVPAAWKRTTPQPPEPNPIIPSPALGLDTLILSTVGNSRGVDCDGNFFMRRNAIDTMVIGAYPNGNGSLFNQQFPAPTAAAGAPCALDPVTLVPASYLANRGIPPGTGPWTVWPGDTYPIIETFANGTGSTPPVQPPVVNCAPATVPPAGSSSCSGNQPIATWNASAGAISPAGVLTAPNTAPATVMVTGTNPNGSGSTPVAVVPAGTFTGWLGSDVLPGAKIGAQVVVGPGAGPLRQSACTVTGGGVGQPVAGAPSMSGLTVTILAGPSPVCSPSNVTFWQVTTSSTPPPTPPTVTCSPSSVQTSGTSTCTANQAIATWNATAGTISPAGAFTAPATAQTVNITGTNSNGTSAPFPIQVTSAPPVTVYPTVSFTIGVPGGPQTNVTCTANQTTGAYTCH